MQGGLDGMYAGLLSCWHMLGRWIGNVDEVFFNTEDSLA